jgi:hypothetical protein
MASNHWIKLWNEILDDPKMGRLPDNVYRRCIELFLMAGEIDRGGNLPDTDAIAWRLRVMDEDALQDELSHLEKVGIIKQTKSGWVVVNFAERQRARTATERKQLERQRKATTEPAELYNVTETSPERHGDVTETSQSCHDDVTEYVTKRDTDKIREEKIRLDESRVDKKTQKAAANLCTFFIQQTGKTPNGIGDLGKWELSCETIIELAGGDEAKAQALVSEAILILEKNRYTYKSPSSLVNTIKKQLEPPKERNYNGSTKTHQGHSATPNRKRVLDPKTGIEYWRNADGTFTPLTPVELEAAGLGPK